MLKSLQTALLSLLIATAAGSQPGEPPLAAESARLDRYAATPDGRLIVAALTAEHLGVHRNHLVLLRKNTGQAYSAIFVDELRARGKSDDAIFTALHELNSQVDRQMKSLAQSSQNEGSPPLRGVGLLNTTVDHNYAATFYTAITEVGIEGGRGSLVVGLPLYLNNLTGGAVSGAGDLYAQGQTWTRAFGFDLSPTLTVGFPTGHAARGLGAGKMTVDGTVQVARTFATRLRPFVNAGAANYTFNNVGYQRPYVSTGGVVHFSGGLNLGLVRRANLGFGGFAVQPLGEQQVTSREVGQDVTQPIGPGMGHNGMSMPGAGHQAGGSNVMPQPGVAPFMQVRHATVQAADLRDRGVNVWTSIAIHPSLSLQFAAARSVTFEFTTIRVGLGVNFGRLMFPRAWRP